jgi:preprotein translocase subunit SecY
MAMLESLRNSMRHPGLRNRLLFTIFMLAILRLGALVPVPGVDLDRVKEIFQGGGFLGLIDLFSGGAFQAFAVFAMGVTPYINSSIIMQLLTIVIPQWEEMQKEGEEGRKKIQKYTRYGTVILGMVQAFGIGLYLKRSGAFLIDSWLTLFLVMITLTAGTAFLMWLGEMITEKGIGNGISLIIFANIIARTPAAIHNFYTLWTVGELSIFTIALIGVILLVLVALVILIVEGQRKIPVEYAKRMVAGRPVGGQRTHLPLRINQAGVIPVIFAQSLLYLPQTIAGFMTGSNWFTQFVNLYFNYGTVWFWIANTFFVIFFTYFYTAITFKPDEIADNMKKNGGFIPGYRPGKPTEEYLARISERLTLVGATFLAVLTVLPVILVQLLKTEQAYLGGTAILIVVGVALETMKQIEAQLVIRKYQGFMR